MFYCAQVKIGQLRAIFPTSAGLAAARLFGFGGRCNSPDGESPDGKTYTAIPYALCKKFEVGVTIEDDEERSDMIAAFLLLHAFVHHDTDACKEDDTRKILPILSQYNVNMTHFWECALRGMSTAMKEVNEIQGGTFDEQQIQQAEAGILQTPGDVHRFMPS